MQGIKIKGKILELIKNDFWVSNAKEYDLIYTEIGEDETQNKIIKVIEEKINRV